MKTSFLALTALFVGIAVPQMAAAQSPTMPEEETGQMTEESGPSMASQPTYEPLPEYSVSPRAKPRHIRTPNGMSVQAGGGVGGFTDEDLRDITEVAGNYDVRLTYGTRLPLGIEAAYVGSAQSLDALGVDSDALLFGNGIEASARYNVLSNSMWQPFVTAGAAWKHYSVRSDVNTSNVRNDDDVLEIPLNAGIGWRQKGFVIDARGGVRPSFNNDLLGGQNLSTWTAKINLGIEF